MIRSFNLIIIIYLYIHSFVYRVIIIFSFVGILIGKYLGRIKDLEIFN